MNLIFFIEVKRRINMYCENCGTQMNLGKFCPKCGYESHSHKAEEKAPFNEPIDALPVYNPVNDVPIYNPVNDVPSFNLVKKEKPLTKCIWFAPVTTVVLSISLLLTSLLTSALSSLLYSWFEYEAWYLAYGLSSLISGIVNISLILCLSLGLYALAFGKKFKKHVPLAFLPYASYAMTGVFVGIFSNIIYYFAQFLDYENVIDPLFINIIYGANNIVTSIIKLIIATLISTLIAVKYLKKAEQTRKKLEEYKEKAEETIL